MSGVAGHNSSGGEICNGVKETWNNAYHPARALRNSLISVPALATSVALGADCAWNSSEWAIVCSGAPTLGGVTATTFGGVVNTEETYTGFMAANNGRLFPHEVKHTDQWAIFGPLFAVDYAGASVFDWAFSHATGCPRGHANIFEWEAGMKDGGY